MGDSVSGVNCGASRPCIAPRARYIEANQLTPFAWAQRNREETTMAHPVIDADECIACGVCVDSCPAGVLEVNDVAVVTDEDSCVGCGACQDACPAGAITEIAE